MRNCNQYYSFFHGRNIFVLSQKEGLEKRGVLATLPANYFFKKIWSENNTYTFEFSKIAFPSIGNPNLQL